MGILEVLDGKEKKVDGKEKRRDIFVNCIIIKK